MFDRKLLTKLSRCTWKVLNLYLTQAVRVPKIAPKQMTFPFCYGAGRAMAKKAGKLVGIRLRPHDLRRHAATFASRSNVTL